MDTTEAAEKIGIRRAQLTRFLRRVERGLGVWNPNTRRTFTDQQVEELRLACWQSSNRHQ